ncbi:hypothetical protein [Bosea sp. TAF32]|uniref:hypothetical protein n=1 Tax=Bosea sp. TAF32 TaxID=3237482 RepID=UPI003F8D8FEA
MSSPDLFAWADAQAIPASSVVDFRARRERLPRWRRLEERKPYRNLDLIIDREDGRAAPVQILRFPLIHPAAHLAYVSEPTRALR